MAESIRVIITGRVQGVGYRAWTVATASRMGLKGWVRNRSEGSVEAVFSGESSQISAMIEACKQGPTAARVDGIDSYRWDELLDDNTFVAKATL